MSKIVIPAAAVGRRQVMASAGASWPCLHALATPAIAQNKPIRMGWIAAVTGMFASNAHRPRTGASTHGGRRPQ